MRMKKAKNRIIIFAIASLFLISLTAVFLKNSRVIFKIAFEKAAADRHGARLVKWFSFKEADSLKEWEEKIFKGHVVYVVEKDSADSFVRAKSDKAASALYYRIRLDARTRNPIVKWRWGVERFPVKSLPESLETSGEDDFAARVYVIFPAKFITNSKVIEYIWAESLPEGTTGISPYSKNIRLMVLRSGLNADMKWSYEERDIIADYARLFGAAPRIDVGAVAFMTDADTTNTSADSVYTDIKLGYKE